MDEECINVLPLPPGPSTKKTLGMDGSASLPMSGCTASQTLNSSCHKVGYISCHKKGSYSSNVDEAMEMSTFGRR